VGELLPPLGHRSSDGGRVTPSTRAYFLTQLLNEHTVGLEVCCLISSDSEVTQTLLLVAAASCRATHPIVAPPQCAATMTNGHLRTERCLHRSRKKKTLASAKLTVKKKLNPLINSKHHLLEELTKQKEMHDLFVEDTEIYLQHVNKEHTHLECSVSFWKSVARSLDERAISEDDAN
jgi:hypothetical protein